MPTPNLPHTTVRLANASSFYVLREDSLSLASFFQNIFSPRTQIGDIQNQMKKLDGIVSFAEDQMRSPDTRYEVDSNIRGEPLEILGSPTSHSIRIRRAMLYGDDLISTLGYENQLKSAGAVEGGLLSQTIATPFIFIKKDASPSNSGVGTLVTFYRGCMLTNISRQQSVEAPGGNLAVYEDATFYYAGRQQFTS